MQGRRGTRAADLSQRTGLACRPGRRKSDHISRRRREMSRERPKTTQLHRPGFPERRVPSVLSARRDLGGFGDALWIAVISGDLELPTAFDPVDWHAHELMFGYGAAIVCGFLLTAVPNWTGRLPVMGWPLAVSGGPLGAGTGGGDVRRGLADLGGDHRRSVLPRRLGDRYRARDLVGRELAQPAGRGLVPAAAGGQCGFPLPLLRERALRPLASAHDWARRRW